MFKGLGGLGNMAALFGHAQKLPGMMQEMTERLKLERVHATTGGGAVQVTINGIGQMQAISIDPGARENPLLEEWITEACNQAGAEAKQRYTAAVSRMASEMNINVPGLDGILANLTGGA